MFARFLNKLKKWNRDRKLGKQEGYSRIPNPRPETAIWVEDEHQPGGVFSLATCLMCACEQKGILRIYPVTPWVYKTEVLSFYKERTETFLGNQKIRYWSYYYIHPQMEEQYQITIWEAKTHFDSWVQGREQGWELPPVGPQVGLDPIVPTVFLFEKPKRCLSR